MEVGNFPTNSGRPTRASAEERTPVEAVVSGSTKTHKRSKLEEMKHSFFHTDLKRLKEYAVEDILIPSIKRGIDDVVSNGIHMLLYNGEMKRPSSTSVGSSIFSSPLSTTSVSYRKISEGVQSAISEPRNRVRGFEFEDILFDDRGDAELTLRKMQEVIATNGVVDILTMYDFARLHAPYTYYDYGWKDLSTAYVYSTRVGGEIKYLIYLPPALPLR